MIHAGLQADAPPAIMALLLTFFLASNTVNILD